MLRPTSAPSLSCAVLDVLSVKMLDNSNSNALAAVWELLGRCIGMMSDEHFGYMTEDPKEMNDGAEVVETD